MSFAQTVTVKVPCTPDNMLYISTQENGFGCLEVTDFNVYDFNTIDCNDCFVPKTYGEVIQTTPEKKQVKVITFKDEPAPQEVEVQYQRDETKFIDRTNDNICTDCGAPVSQVTQTRPEKSYSQKLINYVIDCFVVLADNK